MSAVGLALSLLVSGCCVPISSAKPLTTANLKNAVALDANLRTFLDATSGFFRASVGAEAIRQRTKILEKAERGEDAATLTASAAALSKQAGAFPAGADREEKKNELRRLKVLAAAVAFDGLDENGAASISSALDALYRRTDLTEDEQFTIAAKKLGFTKVMSAIDQAELDILASYDSWAAALRQQAHNGKVVAESLATATKAEVSPSSVVGGVLGDPALTKFIAEAVKARTNDPERAKAASDLIKSLSER